MPILTTDTTLILTGPEEPIASLTINGDTIRFTAYDGTLESTTAGTPYALAVFGFNNQDDAFYEGYGDVVIIIDSRTNINAPYLSNNINSPYLSNNING